MHTFTHIPIDIPHCKLNESNHTHVYTTPSGKKLTSVTTMLSKTKSEESKLQIQNWRERAGEQIANYIFSESAIIGRETHTLNENYINMIQNNEKYRLISHAHHNNIKPFLDNISNVYGVEVGLFSEKLELAGTADLIADYNGKLSVIDYKTKRSFQQRDWIEDYFIQTTAYSEMWNELTNQSIEQIVILVSSEQNTMQEFIDTPENYNVSLTNRINQYNQLK